VSPSDYTFTSRPSVIVKSKTPINLELYAMTEGNDSKLVSISYNGSRWSVCKPHESVSSAPSVIYWNDPESIGVFARNDTSLVYKWLHH